jgi:hypothetical protein
MRIWIGLIAALLLTGCGGVMDALEYADLAQEAQGRNARVAELANTSFASMPDTGSVSYTGHASLAYSTGGAEVILLGNASVVADFGSDVISGQADHFFGGTGISDVQDYDGALAFDGVIGLRRPNSFDAVIEGAISGGGQSFVLSGPLLGDFRGQGGQAISAITNAELEATLNGEPVMVRVKVTAERSP